MKAADSISTPGFGIVQASITVDVDLVALANTRLAAIPRAANAVCARRIYVGTSTSNAGVLNVTMMEDPTTTLTYKNVPQGSYLTGQFLKIVASGTTVADLVVEY